MKIHQSAPPVEVVAAVCAGGNGLTTKASAMKRTGSHQKMKGFFNKLVSKDGQMPPEGAVTFGDNDGDGDQAGAAALDDFESKVGS